MNARSLKSHYFPLALGAIIAVQAGLTILDPTPRYIIGDSGSYLWSIYHAGPYDRSWTYPAWFLRPIMSFHSVQLVTYVQCALGVIPAWVAFRTGVGREPGRGCATSSLLSRHAFASSSRLGVELSALLSGGQSRASQWSSAALSPVCAGDR